MLLDIGEIIKQSALEIGLEEPSGIIVSSTDVNVVKLLMYALVTGRELRSKYIFPQLKKTHSFITTGSGQYALPGDFFRMLSDTQWDRNNSRRVVGPLTDQAWNYYQYGIVTSNTRKRYQIFGTNLQSGQFFLSPDNTAGETISFDYLRHQWFFPKQWTAGESVTSGTTYRSNAGKIYLAQTTATTGATGPTHSTGTASDGTVSWLYVSTQTYGANQRFQADSDFPLLDHDLIQAGIVWRYQEKNGYDYGEAKKYYYEEADKRSIRMESAPLLSMSADSMGFLLNDDNLPDGNYG